MNKYNIVFKTGKLYFHRCSSQKKKSRKSQHQIIEEETFKYYLEDLFNIAH